ncbi:pseudouridine synthase pus4 [Fusarium oxysporum]|nr:pseudouridine synthase pus4 [Fusarium oxysporum]
MAELARTRQSDFEVGNDNCLEYEDLAKGEEVWGPQVARMLESWSKNKPQPPLVTSRIRRKTRRRAMAHLNGNKTSNKATTREKSEDDRILQTRQNRRLERR